MDPAGGTPITRETVIEAIRENAAQGNLTDLIKRMHSICYNHCVTAPSASLTSKEQTCLSQCMEKYMDMRTTVGRQWNQAIQREREAITIGTGAGSGSSEFLADAADDSSAQKGNGGGKKGFFGWGS